MPGVSSTIVGSGRPSGESDRSVLEQRLRVMLDRLHAALRNSSGKICFITSAIRQHVRDAAGHAQIVFQHDELAVGQADQIRARHRDVDIARHLQAAHLAAEMPAAINQLARNDAVVERSCLRDKCRAERDSAP